MTILQDDAEIDGLAELFAAEGVRSFLEIGSKFGGSLYRIAKRLPVGSRVVSVDLPKGTKAWPQSEAELKATVQRLQTQGYDARLIWGDSTSPDVVAKVMALGPFDAIFIDANHTLPFVQKDWANYGPMGRLIAFHDIAWKRAPTWEGVRIDVPEFWDQIKAGYRHQEFKFCPTGKNNGIGVLWRFES
ncbi:MULTISPECIES: class I SAM-dependent methyltransferase [unclassified Mesorhizobium]|uniref:class I SAM-dependent methyltransferase n=1 Tax=unclassified Mesorhizobium TaxID=325217 RepID=UPI000FD933E9|nr:MULTISPECIES: class I SAM-dependent methyltransferase [unclassified Mesorhizobium]TGT76727.1 class I SAM-dependent methyltransferase [Mesorhizobium sp. M2E.F.Ca.ET.166.01.1.1]TGW02839.1 class I SAM-dependent methyltransferase [Mesorhizobium sp. M2E.F.Ca.ET.154.01.1.1]